MEKGGKIKVDKNIKPISFNIRKPVPLNIGSEYYVSYGNNYVRRCILSEILENSDTKQVRIEIPIKPRSKKGFIDKNGNISHNWTTHILYSDEIGLTPEEAVINEVTF